MNKNKKYYIYSFLLSIFIASFVIIPKIIEGNGIFNLWGDFNNQQITFGIYVNDMIKSGNINWNWTNHLGNSFLISFSFYNLTSVFYLISLLFKSSLYPYLIGPILILKYGVAGLTSYAYIQTFVKNKKWAIIGSILYSFSGFQITNMMFNHFHDVVALFPLLLLALDNLIIKNKRGLFALVLCLMAITNYFFFVGQCVFLFIYFICNIISKRYILNKNKFFNLLFEIIVGVLLSCIVLFPSILNILNNPRADISWNFISMIKYNLYQYIDIIKSFVIVPDTMSSRSFINNKNFTSIEQYLPFVGIMLVIPFIKNNKKNFLTYILIFCVIFMFVPILNNSFYAFTPQYYARWLYMPILLYCVCSVKTLEEKYSIKSGLFVTIGLYILFFALLIIYKLYTNNIIFTNVNMFIFNIVVSVLSMIILLIIYKRKDSYPFYILFISMVLILLLDNNISLYLYDMSTNGTSKLNEKYTFQEYYKNFYLGINDYIKLDNTSNYRIEEKCDNNISMILNKPALNSFISTANNSVYKFYHTITYDPYYNPPAPYYLDKQYSIKTFLNTRYIVKCNASEYIQNFNEFVKSLGEYKSNANNFYDYYQYLKIDISNYNMYSKKENTEKEVVLEELYKVTYKDEIYTLYENKNMLNFGIIYNDYIKQEDFNELTIDERNHAYLKGIILNENQIEKYKHLLTSIDKKELHETEYEDYINDYNEVKANENLEFNINNEGFTAQVNSNKDNLILFTVPYDKGWKAYINGEQVEIEEVSNGFMAVKINKGNNKIEFKYKTYGQTVGLILSIIGIVMYLIYIIYLKCVKRNLVV